MTEESSYVDLGYRAMGASLSLLSIRSNRHGFFLFNNGLLLLFAFLETCTFADMVTAEYTESLYCHFVSPSWTMASNGGLPAGPQVDPSSINAR